MLPPSPAQVNRYALAFDYTSGARCLVLYLVFQMALIFDTLVGLG